MVERAAILVLENPADGIEVGGLPVLVRLELVDGDLRAIGSPQRHLAAVALLAADHGARGTVDELDGAAGCR